MAHMIIHPLTPSSSPRGIWGSRLRAVWWRCCCFSWQSEQTACLYLNVKSVTISLIHLVLCCLKLTIFKTSWFSLRIKPLQFYTASIHSIFGQVHRDWAQITFLFTWKERCVCAYQLSLITFLMSKFSLNLSRIWCLFHFLSCWFLFFYISHHVEFVLLLGENKVCGLQDFRETALGDLMSVDMFMWWKEQPLISLGVMVAEDLCWFAK